MSRPRDAGAALHLQASRCTRRARLAALALCGWLALPGAAAAQFVPLEDLLQIVVTPRELLAIDATGGGETPERLLLGEEVLFSMSRGRVGAVLTDQRILAVEVDSGAWQSVRYLRGESRPHQAELGDRVVLFSTNRRVLGFGNRNLAEESIGPSEQLLLTKVSANLAVAVTSRRALALSPFTGGFFEIGLRVGERIEGLTASSDVATLTTSQRLLIFRGRAGTWSERRLGLR